MDYTLCFLLLLVSGLSAADKEKKPVTIEDLRKELARLQQQQFYTNAYNTVIRSFGFPVLLSSQQIGLHAVTQKNDNPNQIISRIFFEDTVYGIVNSLKQQIFTMLTTASPGVITQEYINEFWGNLPEGKSFLDKLELLRVAIKTKIDNYEQDQKKEQAKRELSIKRKYGWGNFLFGGALGLTAGILGMRYYYGLGSFQQDAVWAGNKAYNTGKGLAIAGYNSFFSIK